jgi:hypothetical protein
MRVPADRAVQRDGQHGRGQQLCMHEGMKTTRALVIEACLFVQEWRPNSRRLKHSPPSHRREQEEQSENLASSRSIPIIPIAPAIFKLPNRRSSP